MTGTTRSIVKSGGMNGRSSRTAIWKPMTARSVWICVPMPDRGLILSLLSMRAAVRQMEKRGIQTNIGNLNREIRAANRLMKSIRQLIQNLKGWITELGEKRKELLAQKAAEEAVFFPIF